MNFSEIILTDEEYAALEATANDPVLISKKYRDVFQRLQHFGLVDIVAAPGYDSDYGIIAKCAMIADLGKDYLAFRRSSKKDKQSQFLHDIVLIVITALVTLLIDHIGDIVACFQ